MTTQDKANRAASERFPLLWYGEGDNITMSLWQGIFAEGYMRGLSELWQEVDVNNIPDGVVIAKMKNYHDVVFGFISKSEVSGHVWVNTVEISHYIEIETLLNILKETK
jgi:hypothetical protein